MEAALGPGIASPETEADELPKLPPGVQVSGKGGPTAGHFLEAAEAEPTLLASFLNRIQRIGLMTASVLFHSLRGADHASTIFPVIRFAESRYCC